MYAGFRGGTEHCNLSPEHIRTGMYPHNCESPELAGLPFIEIETFTNFKTEKLTITSGYSKEMGGLLRFTINREDKGCFGACMERFMAKLAPGQKRFYCYPLPPSSERGPADARDGILYFYKNKPLGVNTIRRLMKRAAKRLGISENFMPHSLRALCITKLVNNKAVSQAETMKVARHNSVAASVTYQEVDAVSEHNRLLALGVKLPPKEEEEKKPASVVDPACTTLFQEEEESSSEEEEEKVVLQGRSSKKMFDPPRSPKREIPDVSMTQVGIHELKNEIFDLEELMKPKVVAKKEIVPPPLSENQRHIQELRGVVRTLKRKLEHEKLYYESVLDENERENQDLKERLRTATSYSRGRNNEILDQHENWILNKGYTRDRERAEGTRRRFY
jgi:hypothetical protein